MNEETSLIVQPQIAPDVWNMLEQIGLTVHTSRKFGVTSQQEAAMKLLFCWENGLALSAANTGLYIVNGRMAAQSNIIAAQLRRHPDYDYKVVKLDNEGCTIQILRRRDGKWEVEGEASFTKEDAKLAGMDSKDNYKTYPSDMFFARAISRAQRRYAPDVFGGPVYTPEELNDGNVVEGSWKPVADTAAPAPQPAPAPAPAIERPVAAVITLDALLSKYSAEAIVAANQGRIPGTDEELRSVAAALEVQSA